MTVRVRDRVTGGARSPERGQAAVELALLLPLLVVFLLAIVQTALIARDAVLVQDAARAAAREASVDAGADRIRDAARRTLARADVTVDRGGRVGDPVHVVVRYVDHTDVPMVGRLLPDLTLHASATMRIER